MYLVPYIGWYRYLQNKTRNPEVVGYSLYIQEKQAKGTSYFSKRVHFQIQPPFQAPEQAFHSPCKHLPNKICTAWVILYIEHLHCIVSSV